MEESIETRYAFVFLLAIADPRGFIIGTDIAVARRLNMALEQFRLAIAPLLEPDPDSNSQECEGRRLVRSDGERGYQIVNYIAYRNMRDEEHRREYMRLLMAEKRKAVSKPANKLALVSNVSNGKQLLAQAEEEAEAEAEKTLGRGAPPTTTEDFLKSLKSDAAYAGIDVQAEFGKMCRWCEVNHKKATHRRFINWLNRCDKPVTSKTQPEPDYSKGLDL